MTPFLGCIADDVTGGTDLASNLVEAGMPTVQWLGRPEPGAVADAALQAPAIVVSLKTRSCPQDRAVDQSIAALRALQKLGASRFYFKYCSTFDSTDDGNIGPVAEALLEALSERQTVFCPAFPENGRTVYRGHLFVHDRLLHESGMERHPLNPMTDANLVRVLSRQVRGRVGLLSYPIVRGGAAAIRQELQALEQVGQQLIVLDALEKEHLDAIAAATADRALLTGGSGLAAGLPAAYRDRGWLTAKPERPAMPRIAGGTLILAGSCSTATQQQVSVMQARCPARSVNVQRAVVDSNAEVEALVQWARVQDATSPLLIYSTARDGDVAATQQEFGREQAAARIEETFASLANRLVSEHGVTRLIIAGGETAGAVVARLGVSALRIGPRIAPGVPWTESIGPRPLAFALKSGNFGGPEFFSQAVEWLR